MKTMKKALSIVLSFLMVFTTLVFFNPIKADAIKASDFVYGNYYYYPAGTKFISDLFNPQTSVFYLVLYLVLIVAFAYFYVAISFNPIEVANNIKNNGGSIVGIRPGKPTSDYISKVLSKITLIGAIFLGIVAGLPMVLTIINPGVFASLSFGGSSLLIVVGVALETAREIEAQMTMRHYKGFLD